MAKSKSFFGLRRGSTKSMTFQVLNGAQVTKDRVADVKNPRTNSQMVQRMIMTTAGAAYQHFKAICNHSFEGVSYGQRSYSEFMRLNVKDMVEDVRGGLGQFSYNPYGDTNLYASPFILSRGSLNNPNKVVNFANENDRWQAQIISQRVDTSEMTVNQMLNEFGLKIGDYLTIVGITKFTNETSWHFFWVRLKVKAGGSTIVDQTNFNDVFEAQASEEPYGYAFTSNGFEVDFDWTNVEDDQIFGTTILSRKSNNKWLRSNAQIIFPGSPINNPTATEALATYPVGTDYILNGARIAGGGITPDNKLRLVGMLEGEQYKEFGEDDNPPTIVASFNRDFTNDELVGKIQFLGFNPNDQEAVLFDRSELNSDGMLLVSSSQTPYELQFNADGHNLLGLNVSDRVVLVALDYDNQNKKIWNLQSGQYLIKQPKWTDQTNFLLFISFSNIIDGIFTYYVEEDSILTIEQGTSTLEKDYFAFSEIYGMSYTKAMVLLTMLFELYYYMDENWGGFHYVSSQAPSVDNLKQVNVITGEITNN